MSPTTRRTVAVIVVVLCLVAVARTLHTGFATVDADDPHYLFQGRTVLELRMPEQVDGSFPNLRAPLYGVVIAAGDRFLPGEGFVGAHLVAFALALATLAAAVVIGARIGGVPSALGVALALLLTPLVWRMLPSLRIDLVHAGAVLGVLLVAWRPTTRRWALAGVAFGLTLLMKESVILLAALPCAWLGLLPARRVARLAAAYLGAAVLTAGWWWVLVWVEVREIFPAGNVATTLARDLDRPFDLSVAAWVLVGALAVGWAWFVARWRHDRGGRLVIAAGLATLAPAVVAWHQELDMRQYTPLVVVSCVAAGTALGHAVAEAWRARDHHAPRAALAGGVAVLVVALALGAQLRTPARQTSAGVAPDLSTWMEPRVARHAGVVMTHRDHGELAIRLQGEIFVHRIDVEPADAPALADYVWLEAHRGSLLGATRAALADDLRRDDTAYLVLTGPHLLALPGLEAALLSGEARPRGLSPATTIRNGGYYAHVFAVDPTSVDPRLADLPLAMTAGAALIWLEERGDAVGVDGAVTELVRAGPLITGAPGTMRALRAEVGPEVAAALDLPRSPLVHRR